MQVLVFEGPQGDSPGSFLRVAIRTADGGLSHPWDVQWWKGRLFVTTHTARHEANHSRVNMYDAASGRLLRSFQSPSLNQPNMIAIE